MATPNLLRVWLRTKTRNNFQTTVDPNGVSPTIFNGQETWGVQYDGVVDAVTAQTAAGLPVAGTVRNGLFVSNVQALQAAESPYVWDAIVTYASRQIGSGSGGNVYGVSIARSTAASEETTDKDRLGLPLVNTGGELLPEKPTVTLHDTVWTISFTSKVPPPWPDDLPGKTCSGPFSFTICGFNRSYGQSQAKCIRADIQTNKTTNGTTGQSLSTSYTYDCVLSIQIRFPKWVWRAPNVGWQGYDGTDTYGFLDVNRNVIADGDTSATKATTPIPLSLDGHALDPTEKTLFLPDDAIGQTTGNAGRSYVADGAFELEDQVDFAPLFVGLNDSEQVQPLTTGG